MSTSANHAQAGAGAKRVSPALSRSSFLNRIEPLWTIGGNLRKATKKHPKWCGSAAKYPNTAAHTSLQLPALSPCVSKTNIIHDLRLKYCEKHSCPSCCHSFWHLDTNKQPQSCTKPMSQNNAITHKKGNNTKVLQLLFMSVILISSPATASSSKPDPQQHLTGSF